MWWFFTILGIVLCVVVALGFIIAVTSAETGESWRECTKRFLKGFFKGKAK